MQSPITIGGTTILPGTRKSIELPLPRFYTYTSASMPMHVVHGKNSGPCLLVCAAIHGDEIIGVEIIRRTLEKKLINTIKGTLIVIPIVNVFGFVSQSRYLPDRRDLNRSFPGSQTGSMASRLANLLITEIQRHCTHVIDLHTAAVARENLPQIRADVKNNPETEKLARAFGVPVIINSEYRDGSFRAALRDYDIPVLLYEAGEALRFDEIAIRAGVKGILGVMNYLGMTKNRRKPIKNEALIATHSKWLRAPQSGIMRSMAGLGSRVRRHDVLARINDPLGDHEENVLSPSDGIIIGKTNLPLVHEGEAIYHIAEFTDVDDVSEQLESYHEEIYQKPVSDDSGQNDRGQD